MEVICDCGKLGTARKILVQDKYRRLYTCYYYFGNPHQNFVVDEKGNLIHGNKEYKIIIAAMNYVIDNYIFGKENKNGN